MRVRQPPSLPCTRRLISHALAAAPAVSALRHAHLDRSRRHPSLPAAARGLAAARGRGGGWRCGSCRSPWRSSRARAPPCPWRAAQGEGPGHCEGRTGRMHGFSTSAKVWPCCLVFSMCAMPHSPAVRGELASVRALGSACPLPTPRCNNAPGWARWQQGQRSGHLRGLLRQSALLLVVPVGVRQGAHEVAL